MTREDPPLRIRLPVEIKKLVQTAAAANRRSMNAEIVARLEASLQEGNPSWLDKVQASPRMQTDKRLLALEIQLDLLKDRVATLEGNPKS